MAVNLPVDLPSIERVLHPERQLQSIELEETDMQKNTIFKCSACMSFPLFPVMLQIPNSKCFEVFCKSCLDSAERNRELSDDEREERRATGIEPAYKCPVCRTPYKKENIIPVNRWSVPLRRQWDLVTIKCPFKCKIDLTASIYLQHVNGKCNMRPIKCPGYFIIFIFFLSNFS